MQKRDYLIQGRAVNCKITQSPLDVDLVAQIEVCTEGLVCTRYVPFYVWLSLIVLFNFSVIFK